MSSCRACRLGPSDKLGLQWGNSRSRRRVGGSNPFWHVDSKDVACRPRFGLRRFNHGMGHASMVLRLSANGSGNNKGARPSVQGTWTRAEEGGVQWGGKGGERLRLLRGLRG
jgi:hypothetical protein